jgi:hypothetical protein
MKNRKYFIKRQNRNTGEFIYTVDFPEIGDYVVPFIYFINVPIAKLTTEKDRIKFEVETTNFTRYGKISIKINNNRYQLSKPKIALGTTNVNNLTANIIDTIYLNGIKLKYWLKTNLIEKLKQGFVPDMEALFPNYDPTTIKISNLWSQYRTVTQSLKKTNEIISFRVLNRQNDTDLYQEYTEGILAIDRMPPDEIFKVLSDKYQYLTGEDLMAMSMFPEVRKFTSVLTIPKLILLLLLVLDSSSAVPIHILILNILERTLHKVVNHKEAMKTLNDLGISITTTTQTVYNVVIYHQNPDLKNILTMSWLFKTSITPNKKIIHNIYKLGKNTDNLMKIEDGYTKINSIIQSLVPNLISPELEDKYTIEII